MLQQKYDDIRVTWHPGRVNSVLSRASGYVNLFVLIVSVFLQAVVEPRSILDKEQGIAT